MPEISDGAIDDICGRVFLKASESEGQTQARRQVIRRLITAVEAERAKGRSFDLIRRAMANANRADLADQGIDLGSARAETETAQSARAIDAAIELVREMEGPLMVPADKGE